MKSREFLLERYSNKKKTIVFFGGIHTLDLVQQNLIRREIEKLNPQIILVEDEFYKVNYNSEEEAIRDVELGYVVYLAKKRDIPVISNDPSHEEQALFLSKLRDLNYAFVYFILRSLAFSNKFKDQSFHQVFKRLSSSILLQSGQKDRNYDFQNFKEDFKGIFQEDFNPNNDYKPYFFRGDFKIISERLDEFRDDYMIDLLKESLKKYDRIFITKGRGHLEKYGYKINHLLIWGEYLN